MLQRCSRCVLPETYPGIQYDAQGVCNLCRSHKERAVFGRQALDEMIKTRKKQTGPYDSIVALSGGRDSTYVAYYAARELGLRPLLYTFDNGMMPEQTIQNLSQTANRLGLDHVVEKSDHVLKNARHILSCWIHKPSPAMIGLVCSGCRTGYVRGLAKTARRHQIGLVLTGGGEPTGLFAQSLLSSTGRGKDRGSLVTGLAHEWLANPRYAANPAFIARLGLEFFYRFYRSDRKAVRSLALFRFIPWDENTIVSTIEGELGWKKATYTLATWRSDCTINELKNYLYKRTLGFTKNDELLSGMIRSGQIGRDQALERLVNDNAHSPQFIARLCAELGVDHQTLERALDAYARPAPRAA